jgi:DNA-binding NtrC family response regulator
MKDEERILFVDDDPNLLASFVRQFGRRFNIVTAPSAEEALRLLRTGNSFSIIVSDQRMRGMDGATLLAEFNRRVPGTMRILLTGLDDQAVAVRAINEGHVFSFLSKPVALDALENKLEQALAQWRIQRNEREFIDRAVGDIELS